MNRRSPWRGFQVDTTLGDPGYGNRYRTHTACSDQNPLMVNPYAPSKTPATNEQASRPKLLWPRFGLFVGSAFTLGALYSAGYIAYLCLQYPGLTDPPSRPVDYWPEIGGFTNSFLAPIAACIGVPVLLYSRSAYRRRKSETETLGSANAAQDASLT